jgi:hypothetical protein
VVTDGEVFIEMNPLLACDLGDKSVVAVPQRGRDFGVIEPRKIGSGNQEGILSVEKIPLGWPSGTVTETLFGLFRQVWEGEVRFTRPQLS